MQVKRIQAPKKIGGVETQVDKESSNGKSKNEVKVKFDLNYIKRFIKDPEFIKYAKIALGLAAVWGTHEGLSYFNPGQFYGIPAKFSITGQVLKRTIIEISNALDKIGKLDANFLIDWTQKNNKVEFEQYKVVNFVDRLWHKEKLMGDGLMCFKNLLVTHGIDENTIGTIVENFDLHLYYFKYEGFYGVKVVYSPKGLDLKNCDVTEVFGQKGFKFFKNDKSVILISAAKAIK